MATQFFINGAIYASFVPRLPEIRDRLDLGLGTLGVMLAAAAIFGMGASLIVGQLIERFTSRWTMTAGAAGLTVALCVIGLAGHPLMLLVGLGMVHSLDVIVDVSMNLQGSWLSGRRHTPVMNRLHGLWSLGTVTGGLVSTGMARAGVSVQTHLIATAAVLALALVFVSKGLLPQDEATPDADSANANVGGAHNTEAPEEANTALVRPARGGASRALVLMAIAGALAIVMEVTSSDWAAFRLADDFGASAGIATLGFVAYTAGMTISRFSGDWLEVRLGPDRLLRVAIVVAAIGLAGQSLIANQWITTIFFVAAGLGNAPFFPRLYDMAAKLPGQTGRGLGALTGGSRLAGLVGPTVVGSLADTSLSVGTAMAVVTIPAIIAFALVTSRNVGAGH